MSTKKKAGRKRGGKKADQERRLTVGDVRRAIEQSDDELRAEYGDQWESVRAEKVQFQTTAARNKWLLPALVVAPWVARLPKMPTAPAVFSADDIVCMIEGDGIGTPDALALEWGKMIAKAIREGRVSDIHRLADYVEKMQKCRPNGKSGSKTPWPNHAKGLQGFETALARVRLKLINALGDMQAEGAKITRVEVAKRAGVPAKGKLYTEAFMISELAGIPKAYTYTESKAKRVDS
jgi:hypothetical protein